MNERDLWWKIVLVGGFVALAFASVWPLDQKLKYGIDLYGGYSLLYEIDDTDLDATKKSTLSKDVINVLQDRVDPRGVYNLVWRPVGHNRIEIQMPRPSEELAVARQEYESLKQTIQETRLRRSQVLAAVAIEDPTSRAAEFALLAGPIESRIPLLETAAAGYQEYLAEEKAYQERVKRVQADQLTAEVVRSAVEKPASERPAAIEALIGEAPARKNLLNRAAEAWDLLQAARATTQPGATTQPEATTQDATTTRPADADVNELQTKYDALVSRVVAANPNPETLSEGVTIDTVIEKEGLFEKAVGEVLDRRVDRNALELILDSKPEDRTERLEAMFAEYPGMVETIKDMIAVSDSLREKKGGGGRLEDPQDLQRLLRGAGVLEFRILAELDPANPKKYDRYIESLETRGPRRRPGEEDFQWFEIENVEGFLNIKAAHKNFAANKNSGGVICEQLGDKYFVLAHIGDSYVLEHSPEGRDWSLKSARPDVDQNGRPAISFTLDEQGGSRFHVLTRQNLKRQLAIFLDDYAISHATIQSAIRTRGQISGSFSVREVQEAVKKLEAGSLPSKLKEPPISVRSIGPSLGEANRTAGLRAATLGGIGVAIFMLIYYFYAGGIAITAVAMNILFIGAMMSTLGATLTLPGIAGLVLAIGMAVDANVLINERIREELARGTALRMAIKLGYERAFSAILDSNVTTVLTCVILYLLGSEEIKGFGLTLGIGVFINIFTAYFVTRMFFEVMSMLRVPREVTRYPIYAAFGIAAFGALVYGLGYWMNEESARSQSVLMLFGRAIMYCGPVILGIVGLMQFFRAIQKGRERAGKTGIPMLQLIGSPKIDWYGKRRVFAALSVIMVIGGAAAFFTLNAENKYDIEFLGGTSAQIDLKNPTGLDSDKTRVEAKLREAGERLEGYGAAIASDATVTGTGGEWTLNTPNVPAGRLEPCVRVVLEEQLSRINAIEFADPESKTLVVRTKSEAEMDLDAMKKKLTEIADALNHAGEAIATAQVQAVQAFGAAEDTGTSFDIVTRETNKELVVAAIMDSLQEDIKTQPGLSFSLMHPREGGGPSYFVIRSETAAELGLPLSDAEIMKVNAELDGLKGGMAMILDHITPSQTIEEISSRLRAMRLQPGFEEYGWRDSKCIPLKKAEGGSGYSRVMVVVADENYPLEESGEPSAAWVAELAEPEVELLQAALQRQTSLQQITQFDKQVSGEAQRDALIALALSWIVIIIYVWFRFGQFRWGMAAVAALLHDVIIACGCVAITYYIADTIFGRALLLEKFRIDLPLVAAFLTVIGYSVNDTIVVFDRIRENRGRMADVTPEMVNSSVSQTLSRTLLTLLTTLVAVLIMYIFGGPGIHGFNFVLLIGLSIGTYSSIGVASQLLVRRGAGAAA